MALAYIGQSEAELLSNSANEAARQLKAAGSLYHHFGGRIEYATKSPNTFFERLAKLQAGIAQTVGTDPLAGMTDYLFRKEGDKYIAARQELDSEVKGVTVGGVTEDEALVQVLEISAHDGQATIDRTRWVVGPKGKVEETLRRATREVSFDENGRLSANLLSAPLFASDAKRPAAEPSGSAATPTVTASAASAASSPRPTAAENPAPVIERKSTVPPWLVGIGAITAIGLLVWKWRGA